MVVKETSIKERSSAKDTKEAAEKSLSWFPLKWGWGYSQLLSATERAQESFRRKMRKLLLYEDKEKPSAASIDGYLATMRDTNPAGGTEGDQDEALADEASTSESTGPNDLDFALADSQPASLVSAQPSMGLPTLPSQNVQ